MTYNWCICWLCEN